MDNQVTPQVVQMPVVTSLSTLQGYAQGTVLELPPFGPGQPFVARLKRPSMMVLAKSGKIPNALLQSANSLFENGVVNSFNSFEDDTLSKLFGVMDVLCEASFIEPTYQQIKDAGLTLTDEQMLFVFHYCQNGVKQLEPFRE